MQATKTVEFKAAMAAYNNAYANKTTLSEKVGAIAYYHHTLDKLVGRLLDEMGCSEFNRQRDREISEGYSYYTISFKQGDGVLHMLAKRLGLEEIPRFDTSANLRIDVDMTPPDVVAEIRQMERKADNILESAKDALAMIYKGSKESDD